MLKEILEKEYNKKVDLITYVGSVIGAHSGPGTLALFFVGTER
jgi:fatty acid-binding protein DegV